MGRFTSLHATYTWNMLNDEQRDDLAKHGLFGPKDFVDFFMSVTGEPDVSIEERTVSRIIAPLFVRFTSRSPSGS